MSENNQDFDQLFINQTDNLFVRKWQRKNNQFDRIFHKQGRVPPFHEDDDYFASTEKWKCYIWVKTFNKDNFNLPSDPGKNELLSIMVVGATENPIFFNPSQIMIENRIISLQFSATYLPSQ